MKEDCRYLIIEGANCVGKTTIAEQYKDRPYLHHAKEDPVSYEYYYERLKTMPAGCVMDRCWWSELVYAHVDHRPCRITLAECHLLDIHAMSKECDLIFVTTDIGTILRRAEVRTKPTPYTRAQLALIQERYEELMPDYWRRYDTSKKEEVE